MGFYVRKGLNFGPLRLNFSKSGIGLSAGVTGARIGVNSQGRAYVHGGRHGLYYRKNLGSIGSNSSTVTRMNVAKLPDMEIFQDTGHTFPITKIQTSPILLPPLPRKPNLFSWVAFFFSMLWAISDFSIFSMTAVVIAAITVLLWYRRNQQYQFFLKAFDSLKDCTPIQQEKHLWENETASLNTTTKQILASHVAFCWLENQLEQGHLKNFSSHLDFLPIPLEQIQSFATHLYQASVEDALADHQLSEEEVSFIHKLEKTWQIPPTSILAEKELITQFQQLREIQDKNIPEAYFSRTLLKDELPFFEGYGKFLHKRILQTWQENRQRFKQIGYQVDTEGTLRISNRSIEIQDGTQTRTYPIRQVTNVLVSLEEGIIELSLQNRKNPVILTSDELIVVAAILNKATNY